MGKDARERESSEPAKKKHATAPSVAEPAEEAKTFEMVPVAECVPEPYRPAPSGVFRSTDPIEALEEARRLVNYVNALIGPKRSLYIATFSGRDCPMNTWWSAVAAPLGVSSEIVETRPYEAPGITKETYWARCVVRNRGGDIIGTAEAICSRDERRWGAGNVDSHAVLQMAQTRAFVAAHRRALALLPVLAGLHPVSAEEMTEDPFEWVPYLDLDAMPDDVKIGLKNLNWGANKARIHLAPFVDADGVIDENRAVAFLSSELDKKNGGAR